MAATGVSYVGAAADFLASTGHPAVKAIAPLFSVWDTYSNHYYPGGLLLNRLAETYDELMIALDHGRAELLGKFAYYKDPHLTGPAPVDADRDGALLKAALAEHLGNFHMPDFIREFAFKEEGLPCDPGFSSASFSPYAYSRGVRPDVAVYSVSGWRSTCISKTWRRTERAVMSPRACCGRCIVTNVRRPRITGWSDRTAHTPAPTRSRWCRARLQRCASRCCRPRGASPPGIGCASRIAGADADNFGQVPHGRPPILSIQRGGAQRSSIDLPLRPPIVPAQAGTHGFPSLPE